MIEFRFIRFLLVGVLNTVFGYSCFALLLYFGIDHRLTLLISTVLGVLFNFKTSGHLVFKATGSRRIARFVLVYGVVYGINLGGLEILIWFSISVYLAGLILIPPCAVIAYFLQKNFVYCYE